MPIEQKIDIDLRAFSLEAVKRAAYRCSDRFSFDMTVSAQTVACSLFFDDGKSSDFVQTGVAAFRKELLDQDLRETIRAETESVRNVILAHAFSRTGLVKDEPV